ncbi:hypothetical protein QQZ08_008640 [Neonectria magnoliae]|uniref:Uncharacterized protein n=1 Tax=Neonectria magnoliae TaxID=2732573 RepID=A0ABR1HU75_9HYPO
MGHHSKDHESKHDRHHRSSHHSKGKEKEKDRKRSPSPRPIIGHERRKQDLHFAIEPFVKTLFGSKDAKKEGERARRARHEAWVAQDRRRAERILFPKESKHRSRKSSKKEVPQEPEPDFEIVDEVPEASGGESEDEEPEPESDNEAK